MSDIWRCQVCAMVAPLSQSNYGRTRPNSPCPSRTTKLAAWLCCTLFLPPCAQRQAVSFSPTEPVLAEDTRPSGLVDAPARRGRRSRGRCGRRCRCRCRPARLGCGRCRRTRRLRRGLRRCCRLAGGLRRRVRTADAISCNYSAEVLKIRNLVGRVRPAQVIEGR